MRYGFKNRQNRQLVIELAANASPNDIFVLPPYGVRYKELSSEQLSYVKGRYGDSLIIREVE